MESSRQDLEYTYYCDYSDYLRSLNSLKDLKICNVLDGLFLERVPDPNNALILHVRNHLLSYWLSIGSIVYCNASHFVLGEKSAFSTKHQWLSHGQSSKTKT